MNFLGKKRICGTFTVFLEVDFEKNKNYWEEKDVSI